MKNYKYIIPVLLIGSFIGSLFMLINTKAKIEKEYNEYLEQARSYREQEIYVDAAEYYLKALDVKKSLELSIEIGEFYMESDQQRNAVSWGESVISDYPKESKAYEFLMDIYKNKQDYVACFELYEKFNKRKLSSSRISEIISDIKYTFFFNGKYEDVGVFSGNMCPVMVKERWGYVDLDGNTVIEKKYLKTGLFSEDLAPVIDKDNKAFFIDPKGNKKHVVLGVKNVKELGLISNKIFPLFNGKKWAFYDYENNYLFGDYDDVSTLGNGIAAVCSNDKWSLVDKEGEKAIDGSYKKVVMDEKKVVYRNGRLFVMKDKTYSMIDKDGKEYGNNYEDARLFNDDTYAAVKISGKWGFVDSDGKLVIEPQYEDARSFSNKMAAVKKDGKWGFIDSDNRMVIEPQFDDAKDFTDKGSVFVKKDEKWELLRLYKYNH